MELLCLTGVEDKLQVRLLSGESLNVSCSIQPFCVALLGLPERGDDRFTVAALHSTQ